MTMLYNGMELPIISGLNANNYGFQLIFQKDSEHTFLMFYNASVQVQYDSWQNWMLVGTYGDYSWDLYELIDGEWTYKESGTGTYDGHIERIVWTNVILLTADGEVHLAASTPTYPFSVTHTIHADLLERSVRPRIDVVQGDSLTRRVEFVLTAGGVPWTPPDDTTAALSYVRPDGAGKVYDKLDDGSTAYTVSGNRIRFSLLPEMLTVAGEVQAALRILRESDKHLISTFVFDIVVEAEPSYLVKPPETAKGSLPASIIAVKTDADVTVTVEYLDGSNVVTIITLNDDGAPVTVERDGQTCTLTWEGFDE